MTDEQTIFRRLERERYLAPVKKKMISLREVLAGDFHQFDGEEVPASHPMVPDDERSADSSWLAQARWLLRTDFLSGLSNDILLNVRSLVMQSGLRVPEIEFEQADPIESALMALYLKQCFGEKPRGCMAAHQMRLALFMYMTDGVGWTWNGVSRHGVPMVKAIDTLDVTWEPTTALLTDLTWVAARVRGRAGDFADEYGESHFASLERDGRAWRDERIEVTRYWDIEGDDGCYAALWSANGTGKPVILERSENPHYSEVDGWRQPFLPLDPLYFMLLPSTLAPISVVEGMLPAQVSARLMERYIQEVALRGVPYLVAQEGVLSAEAKEALVRGEPMALLETKNGAGDIQRLAAQAVPGEMFQILQMQLKSLQEMSGVSAYAVGGEHEVRFSSEVQAHQRSAGIMARTVSMDVATHWERASHAALHNARFDGMRRRLNLEGAELWYGDLTPNGRIFEHFELDADVVVSEESLRYAPREDRVRFFGSMYEIAQGAAAYAPQSAGIWYRKLLQAAGEHDVASHLAPPADAAAGDNQQLALASTEE